MNDTVVRTAGVAAAYLLGSIPCGLLIARLKGVDIRAAGSGNIGATNVWRVLGKGPGMLTFALDCFKGYAAAVLLPRVVGLSPAVPGGDGWPVVYGCAAVAGHNWPVFLRFRGGKGVATAMGAILGIAPAAALCGAVCWGLLAAVSRYVSVASIGAAVILAGGSWWYYHPRSGPLIPAALTLLAAAVIWRHRGNIGRLRRGVENRIGQQKRTRGRKGEEVA